MCLYKECVPFSPIHSGTLVLFGVDHTSLCVDVKMETKHVKMMTLTESQRSFLVPSLGPWGQRQGGGSSVWGDDMEEESEL